MISSNTDSLMNNLLRLFTQLEDIMPIPLHSKSSANISKKKLLEEK
jgi:hypothetical protein